MIRTLIALGVLLPLFGAAMCKASEMDIRGESIKTRSYPGGIDEEDLRVQPQILAPQRKLDIKAVQMQVLKSAGRMEVNEESTSTPSSNE